MPAGVTLRGAGAVLTARNYGFSMLGMRSGTTVERVAVDGRDRVVRGITVAAGSTAVKVVGAQVRNIASPVDSSAAGYEANRFQTVAGIRVEGNTEDVLIDVARVENVRAAVPVDPAFREVGDYEGPTRSLVGGTSTRRSSALMERPGSGRRTRGRSERRGTRPARVSVRSAPSCARPTSR